MGQTTGFLNIKRKEPKKRSVKQRKKDWKEIYKPMTEEEIKEQAARCMDCGIPFCHGYGCSLCSLIPEFNDLVHKNHWERALKILTGKNPFPEITGRICPALCEAACVCNIEEEPVTIRQIELALVEKGFEKNWIKPVPPKTRTNKTIAVIGSGPAGLTCAYYLNRIGHNVTVYEKEKNYGGILFYGIPDFKLEKNIIQRRIKILIEEGITFENNVVVGVDISLNYLIRNTDAIVLACGALQPRDLPVKGRSLKGIHYAMDYLIQQNKINNGEKVPESERINAKGKRVVVIGGGDTGADCVGTANRQGAAKVYQFEIMPQPPEKRTNSNPWPDYPVIYRTSTSHEEGCERMWNILTKSFTGNKNGNVKELEAVKVKWVKAKKTGAMSFKQVRGSKATIKCDMVILAAGFTGHGNESLIKNFRIKVEQGFIKVDENSMTSRKSIFSIGDMVSGPSLVVKAMDAGRYTAFKVDEYLKD